MQFDAIAVTGSIPELDDHFIQMLRPGGRLFVIVGRTPVMEALLITAPGDGECTHESLFETEIPPLLNTTESELFVL
jgi:protein-L-isoaspartate(D-aspartate) O-methyltransferase